MVNLIKAGDYENACNLLEEVFSKCLSDESFSVETIKCMMFDIVGTYIKVSNAIEFGEFMEQANPYIGLTDCASVSEMRTKITIMLKLLCDFAAENRKDINSRLCDEIDAYIADNYSRFDLGIQMIADHFNMNPAYLSRLYKIQTNEKLLDKISRIRIEKAKQMLKTNNKIKDVSMSVGFSSTSVFIRTFKNYEGITPGQFKVI